MLANYHTHSTFCDGKQTPEEIVLFCIDNGFDAIGFSGHAYTPFDLRYCMKDIDGYLAEIKRLKEKYKNKIQIYCGMEEDAFAPTKRRNELDYVLGSCHYFCSEGKYYPIDSNYGYFTKCLELFDYNVIALAETYYSFFCDYIAKRKPDMVGHFDLITKFDEVEEQRFFNNSEYKRIAGEYICKVAQSDVIVEVNTGAISRGFRKTPYPSEDLLYLFKKQGGKVALASDSHDVSTLSSYFTEAKEILKHIGFDCVYALYDGEFRKYSI